MAERIALFGGSFDPIHFGHLIAARSVLEQLHLDRVLFLPSVNPPHKDSTSLAKGDRRAEMVAMAIEGEPRFQLDDFDLTRTGRTYTIDTVAHFRTQLGSRTEICWIIGADSVPELTQWYRISDLVDSCRVVVVCRPGWDRLDFDALGSHLSEVQVNQLRNEWLETPRIDISATQIRQRVRSGRSIRYLTPEPVRAYIESMGLYLDGPAAASNVATS